LRRRAGACAACLCLHGGPFWTAQQHLSWLALENLQQTHQKAFTVLKTACLACRRRKNALQQTRQISRALISFTALGIKWPRTGDMARSYTGGIKRRQRRVANCTETSLPPRALSPTMRLVTYPRAPPPLTPRRSHALPAQLHGFHWRARPAE
jgi:hypothetical protein